MDGNVDYENPIPVFNYETRLKKNTSYSQCRFDKHLVVPSQFLGEARFHLIRPLYSQAFGVLAEPSYVPKGLGLGTISSTSYVYILVDPCQCGSCHKSVSPEPKGIHEPRWYEQVVFQKPHVASFVS